jgi:integrase
MAAQSGMGVKVRFHRGAWWVFINHRGMRKSKRIGDRDTALTVARAIRERLASGDLQLGATDAETLSTYADAWQKGLSGLKASTLRFYGDNLKRHVLPALGHRPVSALNRADCRTFVAMLRAKGLKLNTVRGISRTLSVVLSQAVEDEKLPANPALRLGRYLRRGDEPETVIQPLTSPEAARLVAVADAEFARWHPWLLCALRTGMRLGELLALQWGDIDWQGHFLVVQRNIVRGILTSPKSHQRRRVDMTPQLEAALLVWRRALRRRWLKKGEPMPGWVFPSLEGTALEERNARTAFARVLEKAKLRQIRIHDLRHTYATLLLQAGAPITYVSQQLGHRDASITLRVYAHWLPDASRREADRLDTLQQSASLAHPEDGIDDPAIAAKFFGLSGEPPRNRTENPQIKSRFERVFEILRVA